MTHLDLFSGIGGFALAAQTVWGSDYHCAGFCEIDPFCQATLRKNFEGVRIWGDIKELSWNEAKDKSDIPLNSSPLPTQPRKPEELSVNANVVESLFPCLPVSPITTGDGGSVPSNVDTSSCVETRGQMQGAVSGCVVNTTLSGKTELGMTDPRNDDKIRLPNGDGECSQETTTPVSCADTRQGDPIPSMPIMSSHGASIPMNGSMSITGSPSALNATRSCTESNGRPRVDLLTAGVPCQPASCAGKRRGASDDRWLWGEAYRIIRETRPKWVILENVRGLLTLGNGVVFEDLLTELESYGYETETCIIPACAVNAPHRRDRVWIVGHLADATSDRCIREGKGAEAEEGLQPRPESARELEGRSEGCDCPSSDTGSEGLEGCEETRDAGGSRAASEQRSGKFPESRTFPDWSRDWREVAFESCVRGVDDGLSRRVARLPDGSTISESRLRQNSLKAYGNAIVPQVAMEIMRAIKEVDDV